MQIKEQIQKAAQEVLQKLGIENTEVFLEFPEDLSHGDFSTNIALVEAKKIGKNPKELAEEIKKELEKSLPKEIEGVSVAGPGFINFTLSKYFFVEEIGEVLKKGDSYGKGDKLKGQKISIEYTNTNVLKPLHIGHLMGNVIGESLSRIVEWQGAEIKRNTYQGDTGLHIAKAVWGLQKAGGKIKADLNTQVGYIGKAYAHGSSAYEDDPQAQGEIKEINKNLFEGGNEDITDLYTWGRKVSLDHLEELYKKLGTKFDFYFFESEVSQDAVIIIKKFLEKKVFEESDGAIVFKGENFDPKLHTRVFVTSQGIPTYEAKDIAHALRKYAVYEFNRAIIITANEQNDYFKVVLRALKEIDSSLSQKIEHMSHGMLNLASGKMSSRTGNVITGESLITQVEDLVQVKIADRNFDENLKKDVSEKVAVGAIKYSILRQSIGRDIIFDFDKSLSFEGDSGPYLQYAHTRAQSILEKAKEENLYLGVELLSSWKTTNLERLLTRFPAIVERAGSEYAPQYVVTYLTELASVFNSWYAEGKIVDAENLATPYKLAITSAFKTVMKNGLTVLGIKLPERM